MERLTRAEKEELEAKIESFPQSGLPANLSPKAICNNYKSLLGRDYKLLAQVALFVFWDFFTDSEKEIWKELSKVSNAHYDPNPLLLCMGHAGFLYYILQEILLWCGVGSRGGMQVLN